MKFLTGEEMYGQPVRLSGCFFGASGGSSSSKVQVNQPGLDARNANITRATDIANQPFQAYSPIAAPQAAVSNINRGDVGNVQGGDLMSGIAKYQNPYQSDVVNSTMADLERQRQIAQVNDASQATAAHAFGGSRSGVTSALTNEAAGRTAASTFANLNQQGFDTAAQLSEADANRAMAAGQANQGADLNVASQNAQAGNQNSQFNVQAMYQEWLRKMGFDASQQNIINSALGLSPATLGNNQSGWNAGIQIASGP
jgi:hypothetical protein